MAIRLENYVLPIIVSAGLLLGKDSLGVQTSKLIREDLYAPPISATLSKSQYRMYPGQITDQIMAADPNMRFLNSRTGQAKFVEMAPWVNEDLRIVATEYLAEDLDLGSQNKQFLPGEALERALELTEAEYETIPPDQIDPEIRANPLPEFFNRATKVIALVKNPRNARETWQYLNVSDAELNKQPTLQRWYWCNGPGKTGPSLFGIESTDKECREPKDGLDRIVHEAEHQELVEDCLTESELGRPIYESSPKLLRIANRIMLAPQRIQSGYNDLINRCANLSTASGIAWEIKTTTPKSWPLEVRFRGLDKIPAIFLRTRQQIGDGLFDDTVLADIWANMLGAKVAIAGHFRAKNGNNMKELVDALNNNGYESYDKHPGPPDLKLKAS